jgi:SagB-type dehydrogenase family enzyme
LQHSLLYCVVNRVQNIPAGIYWYHPQKHVLQVVRAGEVGRALQTAQRGIMHNLSTVSACLFPVANYKRGFAVYGDRWYRMQNMEAGIMVQRIYLAAAAHRLGCRATLGYQVPKMDELLCLTEGNTSLIEVMIGPAQPAYQQYEQSLTPGGY